MFEDTTTTARANMRLPCNFYDDLYSFPLAMLASGMLLIFCCYCCWNFIFFSARNLNKNPHFSRMLRTIHALFTDNTRTIHAQ